MSVKDTPFFEHLDTNYAPTEEELPALRNIIQGNEEILTDLDAQIRALTDVRNARADFVQRHFALLSPLKRLTDDVLSTLFLALLDHPDNRHAKTSNTHPAVVLSHVCRRWRQLALDTASLWTTLRIYPPVLPQVYPYGARSANPHMAAHSPLVELTRRWEKEVEKILTMTRVWLERSKECTLTIDLLATDVTSQERILSTLTIDLHAPNVAPQFHTHHLTAVEDMSPKADTSGLTALIEAICDASRRWKVATLRLSTTRFTSIDSPFRRIFTLAEDDVPLLQDLTFSVDASFGIHPEEESLIPPHRETGMLGGRSLHSVSLGTICVDINTLPIRWEQLTDIQFNGYIHAYTPDVFPGGTGHGLSFDCTQALNLLRLCPRLVNCDLSLVPYSRPLESFGTVSLPHLKSLTLRYSVPGMKFISCLQAPSLRKLVLPNFLDTGIPNEHAAESPESSLIAWLEAYGHQLTEIQFNVSSLTPAGLRSVMNLLPHIKTLRLDHNGDGASFPPTPNGDQVLPMPAMVDELFLGQFIEREDQGNDEPRGPLWCPLLESIRFPRRGGTTFTEQDLLEFVAARRRMHSEGKAGQLREVTVMFGILQEGNLMAQLEEMGIDVEGLTLEVSYVSRIPLRPEPVYPGDEYDF
ncbi:hypothetical protein D9611_005430 [Ephemerocybe angulata]|uniref:F-box domain-containing protein n=1 Tax=Ephemerocybe angulata TaxID=980116 RepID=A0A8H5C0P5_9AGAR|nr:hypothetical protein D9611_005430 [Tulosesus angulatus]